MSKEFQGKVIAINKDTIKSGKNIGKAYYKVTMEDYEGEQTQFNAWAFDAIRNLQLGAYAALDYDVSPDGRFRHINASALIQDVNEMDAGAVRENAIEPPPPASGTKTSFGKKSKGLDDTAIYIHRTSALYNAVEYSKGGDSDIETVLDYAKRFLEFIESGE